MPASNCAAPHKDRPWAATVWVVAPTLVVETADDKVNPGRPADVIQPLCHCLMQCLALTCMRSGWNPPKHTCGLEQNCGEQTCSDPTLATKPRHAQAELLRAIGTIELAQRQVREYLAEPTSDTFLQKHANQGSTLNEASPVHCRMLAARNHVHLDSHINTD